jgi:hypothetical protein
MVALLLDSRDVCDLMWLEVVFFDLRYARHDFSLQSLIPYHRNASHIKGQSGDTCHLLLIATPWNFITLRMCRSAIMYAIEHRIRLT